MHFVRDPSAFESDFFLVFLATKKEASARRLLACLAFFLSSSAVVVVASPPPSSLSHNLDTSPSSTPLSQLSSRSSRPAVAPAAPAPRRGSLHVVAARIAGVEIPNAKRVEASLQYIFGVGPTTAKAILSDTGIDNKRTRELTEAELTTLRDEVEKYTRATCAASTRSTSTGSRRSAATAGAGTSRSCRSAGRGQRRTRGRARARPRRSRTRRSRDHEVFFASFFFGARVFLFWGGRISCYLKKTLFIFEKISFFFSFFLHEKEF